MAEVIVIGAGVIGSSIADQLSAQGVRKISVLDIDLVGVFSSSELNAGGVRSTWVEEINILSSKHSIEFFAAHAEEVGYRAVGYLWMHNTAKWEGALRARERPELQNKLDGIAGAVFGVRDGLVNPNRVKEFYRERARSRGVEFQDRVWVTGIKRAGDGSVEVEILRYAGALSESDRRAILEGRSVQCAHTREVWHADKVINAAGPWAGQIARMCEAPARLKAVRRQISIFDARGVDLTPYGMMIDPSGVYFHPEGVNGLAGFANPDEPEGVNFEYEGEEFFMHQIWQPLAERSTKFEALRHITGWAGMYEVSPDDAAVIGEVTQGPWAGRGRVYEAHSFSGHGLMHSFSAGRGIAELVVKGRYETLDLSRLSSQRFDRNQQLQEGWII